MSLVGKKVAPFAVDAFQDGQFTKVSDKDILGHWSVFFFYPADFTFVCPTELEAMAESYEDFKKIGCEVYSVSTDTHFVHKAWHDSSNAVGKVKFPMLGDPTGVITRDFDVYIDDAGQSLRGSFVVNPEGEIVCYEVHANGIGRNPAELLRKVEAAQFVAEHGDQVCPVNWHPGDKTLKPGMDLVGKI